MEREEFIRCEICGMSNEQELSTRDRDGKYLRTVICKKCGLVYTNPRPLSSEIEEYYKGSYYLDYKGIYQPKKKHIFRAARIAMKRIQQIQKYIFPNMKALDIGSGSGEMVYAMRLAGIDCSGLEPNEGYATYARDILSLPVSIGYIETTTFPRNSYDVVLMYHSMEHLHSPAKALLNIHSCLRPEGIVMVECPNVEAHCHTPSNRLHRAHLYNFNEVTLRALGEKAGFQAIKMSVSSDGGNILAIFRKKKDITPMFELSRNYHRVIKAWTSHTTLKYFLSPYPYRRMLSKVMQFLNETQKTVFAKDSLTLLQNSFAKSLPAAPYNGQKGWLFLRHKVLATSLAGVIFLIVSFWAVRSLMDHSDEIMALTASHQDGNDLFAVLAHEQLGNLKTNETVILIRDSLSEILSDIDKTKIDLHLIVEDDRLHYIKDIVKAASLRTVQIISLGGNSYHLLTTESHYKDYKDIEAFTTVDDV